MVTYPSDWRMVPAEQIVDIGTGCRDTQDNVPYGKYPFFVRSSVVERIDVADYDCEAVLTAGDGVGTGKVFHYIKGQFAAHQRVYVMNNFRDITGRYFYYQFSRNFINEVEKYTAKSSVDSVRRAMIAKMEIPLPSINEQIAIVNALEGFDTHIANLVELIEKKKAIRDGALEDLVSGRVRLDGHSCSWKQVELGSIASYRKERDVQPRRLYISTENMNQMFSGIIPYEGNEPTGGTAFFPGDTLIANIRPYLKKIWCAEFVGTCSADVLVLAGNDRIVPKFLYYSLANDRFISYVMTGGVKGIKMPRGDKKYIMKYPLLIPSDIHEQKIISEMISAMDNEIMALEDERDKMIQIREGAMDDLLTGRVRLVV